MSNQIISTYVDEIVKEYGLTQYENYKPKTTRGYLKN